MGVTKHFLIEFMALSSRWNSHLALLLGPEESLAAWGTNSNESLPFTTLPTQKANHHMIDAFD